MWYQVLKGTDSSALSPSIVTSFTTRENQRWCLTEGKLCSWLVSSWTPVLGRWHGPVWCQCVCLGTAASMHSGVFVRLQSMRCFMLGFLVNLYHLLLFSCWAPREQHSVCSSAERSSAAKKPIDVGYCVHKRPSNVMILSPRRGESLTILFYGFSSSVWEWLQDHCSC